MAEIVKSTTFGVSLATTLPSHNHMIGPDLTAGEHIGAGDACYIATNGLVLRALMSQANAAGAINDVQTITLNNNPTDGTYQIGYPANPGAGQAQAFTTPIPYNANAATIQTAVQALSTVGAGNVIVTGAFPAFTLTAAGAFAGIELDQFVVDPSLLTNVNNPGPAVITASVVHTTVGEPAGTGAILAQGKVRGFAPIGVRNGQPITLYDAVIFGYSDGLLTPGIDLYLSATVPGGLTDTATLTGQKVIAFTMDTQRVYVAGF